MIRIAIIMTVFNRKDKTIKCLQNLEHQTTHFLDNVDLDIYMTNDGCTDGTPETIKEYFPYVNIIDGDGSLYWNRGMFTAWKRAAICDYDYYLWLNDDTYLFNDSIERLLATSELHANKAVIVGSCCASDNQKRITYGGYNLQGKIIDDVSTVSSCVQFNGNILLIPRFVFRKIGFNDSYYRHSLGDFDYALTIYSHNISAFVAQGVYGICDLHNDLPRWCNPKVPLYQRWKAFYAPGGNGANPFEFFYFRCKHFGVFSACVTFISNYVHLFFPRLWMMKNI